MGVVSSLIKKQPNFVKKIYYDFVPFERRYGYEFLKTFNFIMQSKDWETKKLKEYQLNESINIINHSFVNVPYYTNLFNEYGINIKQIQTFEDIKRIPILTKDLIIKNYDNLIAKNFKDQKLYVIKTSGSTGKKLQFLANDDVYKREAAFILRAYKEHGATLYDKNSIWLRRYTPSEFNNNLWYFDYELKRLYMSAYHLNESTLKNYINEIQKNKYHTLVGYPSSIYSLACLLEESKKSIDIKAIHVASEMVLPQWKEKIEKVFNIKLKTHYGQMEKVSLFYQDSSDDLYKECLDYSYTEFIKENNENVVVGTGFINYAMPFIRYKTNDTADLNYDDNHIGLPKTVKQFNGRCDDILISKDGTRIPGVNFYTMMYKIDGIKMFQIIQKSREDIVFKLVKDEKFTEDTFIKIQSGLTQRMGYVNIRFEIVDEIERNKTSGKIRCIFNEIQ
jgi:phenylacetate-CoA ligase